MRKDTTNRLTRLAQCVLLSVLLLSAALPSKAADKVEKTIALIADKVQANKFGPTSAGVYGYQYTTDNRLSIDASACELDNLVLTLQVYIDNIAHQGDLTILRDAGFAQLDLGNDVTTDKTWLSWPIKDLNLQPGWNTLRLELKDAPQKGADFDLKKNLQYFRFCFAFTPADMDAHLIRLKDIRLVDKSQLVEPDDDNNPTWDTTYLIGNTGISINAVIDGANAAANNGFGFALGGNINPAIDVSKHNPKQLYLMFDADITEANEGDLSIIGQSQGQIELTSSGQPDKNELNWAIYYPDWKIGKHTYQIPFSAGGKNGGDLGELDYSAVNYMRMYVVSVPSSFTGNVKMNISNIKIVDLTNDTKLPTVFSDGMVFQQNQPMRIWGYAEEGKEISVDLYKNGEALATKTVTADADGRWEVAFDAQKASYDTYQFTAREGENIIQTVSDILIGELWVAGGQSNMEFTVDECVDATELKAAATNDHLRFFLEPIYPYSGNAQGEMPSSVLRDIKGAYWGHGDNATQVGKMSAVAYTMAVRLQQQLDIPVGILNTAVGGSVIEAWLSREAIDGDPTVAGELKSRGLYFDEEWWIDDASTMTALYNQKIGPLKGISAAGIIWYQGESNSDRPEIYASELDLLRRSWSTFFGHEQGDIPFVFAQVARWAKDLNTPQSLARLDEAMADAWAKSPASMAMLPLYDTDMRYERPINPDPIHPVNKTPIGQRFATAVINMVYGEGEYTAPVAEQVTTEGGKVTIQFSHVGNGLQTIDGTDNVHGFAICGADGIYANATARIVSKNEVEVSNPDVKNPVGVTYAWATYNTTSNLSNAVGIPAAPFRSNRNAEGQHYYNPQDWTFADSETVWGINATGKVGAVTAWTVNGGEATLTFNTEKKQEGRASLQLTYNQGGTYTAAPVLTHKTTVLQLANFKTLSVSAMSLSGGAKQLSLQLKDNKGNTYTAAPLDNSKQLTATDHFETFRFNLLQLTDAQGNTIGNPAETLTTITSIGFVFKDNNAGSVCLDNVLFGTAEAQSTGIAALQTTDGVVYDKESRSFRVSNGKGVRRIELYDTAGQLINQVSASACQFHSLPTPASRIVIVRIIADEGTVVRKVAL